VLRRCPLCNAFICEDKEVKEVLVEHYNEKVVIDFLMKKRHRLKDIYGTRAEMVILTIDHWIMELKE